MWHDPRRPEKGLLLQVLSMMVGSGLTPNIITFNAILNAIEKACEGGGVRAAANWRALRFFVFFHNLTPGHRPWTEGMGFIGFIV